MVLPVIRVAAGAVVKKTAKQLAKEKRIAKFRREASRKASKANKRLDRLVKNNLTDTPAYKQFIESGGERFGIRGKTYNEVRSEVARLDRFINAETSTIRGVNRVLKEIAGNTGIKYKNLKDLRKKADRFFELQSKVEQYLRTVDDSASAIGYQKIWEAINEYTDEAKLDLSNANLNIDQMVFEVTQALKEFEDPLIARLNADNQDDFNWFNLTKKSSDDDEEDDPNWFKK